MRTSTSPAVEVTHISSHGIWLLSGDTEMFMPYDTFPWFKDAPIAKVLNVTESSAGYFNWPDLYVDLSAGIIENPDRFPLIAK
ncbi:MAG: DUF2442 domain-containing protein [Rhodomicrobium sp.]